MSSIKNLLKKWKHELIYNIFYWVAKKRLKIGNPIFLIGTPLHGNIGDQAITMAEYKFLEQHLKLNKNVIEIPSKYISMNVSRWKKIIGDSTILIHGGGFIGSLWPEEYNMIKEVIKTFSENYIIILPQTIYYDSIGKEIEEFNTLMSKCNNITLCAREKISYEFVLKHLPNSNPRLIPDMVTYLDSEKINLSFTTKRNGVMLCLRNDIEKNINDSMYNTIISSLLKHFNKEDIMHTDTFINETIYPYRREKVVKQKILEFSRAKIIITDRLHGMVLAALANTPCIVLSNCNHKVKGVYDWISNNKYIRYIENTNDFEKHIIELLETKDNNYSNEFAIEKFETLDKLINKQL
ncbi:polysaccharide pyruvyl transferase family protein [Clostridium tertium]